MKALKLSPEARKVLLIAKGLLAAGWTQGQLRRDDQVCLFGALNRAAGVKPRYGACKGTVRGRAASGPGLVYTLDDKPAGIEAVKAISAVSRIPVRNLALWNDAEERTVDEVVALIDKTLTADAKAIGRQVKEEA